MVMREEQLGGVIDQPVGIIAAQLCGQRERRRHRVIVAAVAGKRLGRGLRHTVGDRDRGLHILGDKDGEGAAGGRRYAIPRNRREDRVLRAAHDR
jgi:hypothetical protein